MPRVEVTVRSAPPVDVKQVINAVTVTAPGLIGPVGPGVPSGGTAGQILAKIDGTDYNTEWVVNSGGGAASLDDLSDVTLTTPANGAVMKFNGSIWVDAQVDWSELTGVPATFTPASHTHAAADVTSGAFADARISETSVTQHQAALSITESQVSDLGSYAAATHTHTLSDITDAGTMASQNANGVTISGGQINASVLQVGGIDVSAVTHTHGTASIISGTFDDGRIAASNVTQHQAALSITESQISDLGAYLTDAPSDGSEYVRLNGGWAVASGGGGSSTLSGLSDTTITTLGNGEVLVSSAGNWINQTLAEAGIAAASHNHAGEDITSGEVADARLSSNVMLLDAVQSISGSKEFVNNLSIAASASGPRHSFTTSATMARSITIPDVSGTMPLIIPPIGTTANRLLLTATTEGEVTVADLSDLTTISGVDGANDWLLIEDATDGRHYKVSPDSLGLAASSHTHAAADIVSGTLTDARVAASNVTQHQAALSITESQISDLGTYLTDAPSDGSEYVRLNGAWSVASGGGGGASAINDLSDVTITTLGNDEVLVSSAGSWINQTLAEAGIAAATHTHAAADVTSGTFADALIAASNVTQHQAALSITESQISDLGTYLTTISGENIGTLSDVTITSVVNGEVLVYDTGVWVNKTLAEAGIAAASHTHAAADVTSGTFADARIAASNVTQHQAALSITESQISDLGSYAAASHTHAAADVTSGTLADARIAESSVTQHEAALTIGVGQINDGGSAGDGLVVNSAGDLEADPWANAICLSFEETATLSSGTTSGYQWSIGNGDVYNRNAPIPFDFYILGCAISLDSAGTSSDVEVYKGTAGSAPTATGTKTTTSGTTHAYTDSSGSPVSGNAGEFVIPRTNSGVGGPAGGRYDIWICRRKTAS